MPFEVPGGIWVVDRNPYPQDDLLGNSKRQGLPVDGQCHRLHEIDKRRQQGSRAASWARSRPNTSRRYWRQGGRGTPGAPSCAANAATIRIAGLA
jgi:hypothetical protein